MFFLEEQEASSCTEVGATRSTPGHSRKNAFCVYCNKMVRSTNFARHLFNNHNDEEAVRNISAMPLKSPRRINALRKLRGRSALLFNLKNPEKKLVARQSLCNKHLPCPNCNIFYVRKNLFKHLKKCVAKHGRLPKKKH